MIKVLIDQTNRICEIVQSEENTFPVASAFRWIDGPDDVTYKHIFDDKYGFIKPKPSEFHYLKNGVWVEDTQKKITTLEREYRSERDRLLKISDWTQVPDSPVDQQPWADYRQALRDVPQQTGFPTDINWPTKPE